VNARTLRQTAHPLTLLRHAIGGPRAIRGKLVRLGRTLRIWASPRELDRRLDELGRRGYFPTRPSRPQLVFAALDMLRFVIVPAARDYYEKQGIDFQFHQLLRFLDDPVSLVDPTGLLSDRDTIIGHVMQVTHLNPIYDLQLLEMWPDGLGELEEQVEAMLAGTHPRAETIGAIIEDPGYHARLLDYVRRFRENPATGDLVREQTLRDDPHFAAEKTRRPAIWCASKRCATIRILPRPSARSRRCPDFCAMRRICRGRRARSGRAIARSTNSRSELHAARAAAA
jgi:hypothetical protein